MRQSIRLLNINCLSDFSTALKDHDPSKNFELLFVTAAGLILAEIEQALDDNPTLDDYIDDMDNNKFNINAIDYLKVKTIGQLKAIDEVAGDTINFVGDGGLVFLKNVRFYHQLDQAPYLTIDAFALHASDVIGFSLRPIE